MFQNERAAANDAAARFVNRTTGKLTPLITATALQNNSIIATRNGSEFLPCGVQIINPWE